MSETYKVTAEPYTRLLTIENNIDGEVRHPNAILVDWRRILLSPCNPSCGCSDGACLKSTKVIKVEHWSFRLDGLMKAKELDYVISEEDDGHTIHPRDESLPPLRVYRNENDILIVEPVTDKPCGPFSVTVCFYLEPSEQ